MLNITLYVILTLPFWIFVVVEFHDEGKRHS